MSSFTYSSSFHKSIFFKTIVTSPRINHKNLYLLVYIEIEFSRDTDLLYLSLNIASIFNWNFYFIVNFIIMSYIWHGTLYTMKNGQKWELFIVNTFSI